MVDFTNTENSLSQTFGAQKPKSPYAPVVADLKFDLTIPAEVQDSLVKTQAIQTANRTAERQQTDELLSLLESHNTIVDTAEKNLEKIDNNPFSEIIGLFNDEYDASEQRRRIAAATREVNTKVKINALQTAKRDMIAQDAAAPATTYQQMQKMKAEKVQYTTAEMLMISSSNTARKAAQEYEFSRLTTPQIMEIKKTGSYTDVFTPQKVDAYLRDVANSEMEMRAARLAYEKNDAELSSYLEAKAINNAPVQYLQAKYDEAVEKKLPQIDLGGGFKIAPSKALAAIAEKRKTIEDHRTAMATEAVKYAKMDSAFREVQDDLKMHSEEWTGSQSEIPHDQLNILNISDATYTEMNPANMHPALGSKYIDMMKFVANINQKGATEQDFVTLKTMQDDFKKTADEIKQANIEAQPTKELQAAQKEWYTNKGRITSGVNAASITAGTISSFPDFGGDPALEAAYEVFGKNILSDVTGTSVDLTGKDGKIDTRSMLEQMMIKTFKGKPTDQDRVLKAMNTSTPDGVSPRSIFIQMKTKNTVVQAVRQLAAKDVNVKQMLFDSNGRPKDSWANSSGELANVLAALSAQGQKTDKNLGNNYLNFALQDEINQVIAQNAATWNSQQNIARGAFMVNLLGGQKPHQLVDMSIQNNWASYVDTAWETAVKNQQEAAARQTDAEKWQGMNIAP